MKTYTMFWYNEFYKRCYLLKYHSKSSLDKEIRTFTLLRGMPFYSIKDVPSSIINSCSFENWQYENEATE